MKEYVKKRIPVKAVQFYDTNECIEELHEMGLEPVRINMNRKELINQTPDGEARANEGDYVLRDNEGKFHICAQDVFEESYDDYGAQEGR